MTFNRNLLTDPASSSKLHESIPKAHDAKATATLIAQLALAGHAVHKAQGGGFIVTKWGQSRYCANLAELAAFAQQLGVNHG
jgi:hypothetical protein